MRIEILNDEWWYGGCTAWGARMPLHAGSRETLALAPNPTPNQGMPLLVSSRGRYLWLGDAPGLSFDAGYILCPDGAELGGAGGTLRSAYREAMARHFPFSGAAPAAELFGAPIFNTWIELTFDQNQRDVLSYARGILENGFEPGVLMIDDGWAESYGDWRFHAGRFPDPAGMLRELHAMGFRVMLWVCPYVSADTPTFRQARDAGLLARRADGRPFLADWWNGFSAALDLSSPAACDWLRAQLDALAGLGVDGFKFDGGDPLHYAGGCRTAGGVSPNGMCRLWSAFGEAFPFNEYRAAWGAGGRPLLQRLCDKEHSWGAAGLAALVPDTLAQGITGHPFCCADMVGGGEYLDFIAQAGRLDGELFVRHAAVSCLMPAIQFSAAPWRVLGPAQNEAIRALLALRAHYRPALEEALRDCARTGEPMVRYMEYEFPHQGLAQVRDQFMLGRRLLVAPVLEKGGTGRTVHIPQGSWRWQGGRISSRGEQRRLCGGNAFLIVLERAEP